MPTHDHIVLRPADSQEAYLAGTRLSVWEVAWIARHHRGDPVATACDLGIDSALVQEALDYEVEHLAEIETQIHDHVSWTADDISRLMPRARALTIESDGAKSGSP